MKIELKKARQGIIYVRVSSDEQIKGTSLDDQEARCVRYCEDNDIKVMGIFREEGQSAKSANRPELIKAIEFCRKNKGMIDVFLVYKLDRFSRNMEDHILVKKMLSEYGTTLYSVSEPIIGESPSGKLLGGMLALISEFDNDIRTQRSSNGMLARVKSGIWPWKSPVGYVSGQNKKHGQKKTTPEQPHPMVFPLLQKLLRFYGKGLITQKNIVEELAKTDFQKITKIKPSMQFVEQLFGSRLTFYAGWLTNPWPSEDGSDVLVKGKHEAMLTAEEWFSIKQRRNGGGQIGTKKARNNPKFPLRRFVRCIGCQHALTGSSPRGKYRTFDYYHCYNPVCILKYKSIPKDEMENAFTELLGRVVPTRAFTTYFETIVLEHWKNQSTDLVKNSDIREKEMAELKTKRKSIFDMLENKIYDNEQFKERIVNIDNQILAVKMAISETNIDQYDLEAGINYAKQSIHNLTKLWLDLEVSLRAKFQKLVFPAGISYDRNLKFGTPQLGFIFTLNQVYNGPKLDLVLPAGFEPATCPI
ncbi:MAG: hypothetical protein EXS48_02855 [Candidatus Staskawiczbacteria bacterium]|nr:hypothetical protein [Candidatus Staskawiczbacteria bacterium]